MPNYSEILLMVAASALLIPNHLPIQAGNPSEGKLSYEAKQIFPLEAVVALAAKSNTALGIELGSSDQSLCESTRNYSVSDEQPLTAFRDLIKGTGYSIQEKDGVILLRSPDLSEKERSLLDYRYESFPAEQEHAMFALGVQLTEWMQMEAEDVKTFAAALSRKETAEHLHLGDLRGQTTEQIANRIVLQGQRGIWLFEPAPSSRGLSIHKVNIFSYIDDPNDISRIRCAK